MAVNVLIRPLRHLLEEPAYLNNLLLFVRRYSHHLYFCCTFVQCSLLTTSFHEGPIFAEVNTLTVQSELFVEGRILCDRVSAPR